MSAHNITSMEAAVSLTATSNEKKDDELTSEKDRRHCRRGTARQIIACLIANTSVLGPAMGLGYSAVALGPLGSKESEIKVTESDLSWIASVTAIATPIGCVISSFTMRRGRRFAMISASVTSAIGWLVIYFAVNVLQILIGRAICGIAIGLSSIPATVYAAEISAPKLRGIVVTWTSVAIAIGISIVYILGFLFQENWRLVALLSCLFPVLSTILVSLKIPESPVWLRSKGRFSEADEISKKFDGFINRNENGSPVERRDLRGRGALFTIENLKPFLILTGYFFFQQFSGIFVVIYYAVDFTLEAGVKIDGNLAAILISVTRLLATLSVSCISRKYGRRIPSIVSGAGMTLFMGILSAYLFAISRGCRINDNGIIPVLALMMYILTSTMGFHVIPFAMIGEIYAARVKDVLSGLTTCLAYVFSFFVLKMYPDMLIAFEKHGVFFFYALVSLAGTIFVALFLPETKGKTLDEIEQYFKNGKNGVNKSGMNNCPQNVTINDEINCEETAVTMPIEEKASVLA